MVRTHSHRGRHRGEATEEKLHVVAGPELIEVGTVKNPVVFEGNAGTRVPVCWKALETLPNESDIQTIRISKQCDYESFSVNIDSIIRVLVLIL